MIGLLIFNSASHRAKSHHLKGRQVDRDTALSYTSHSLNIIEIKAVWHHAPGVVRTYSQTHRKQRQLRKETKGDAWVMCLISYAGFCKDDLDDSDYQWLIIISIALFEYVY